MRTKDLESLLLSNVLEITFLKINGEVRDMVCTKSYNLLSSFEGRTFLHYVEPKTSNTQPLRKNQLVVWDLEKEDYRKVNCESVKINNIISDEEYRKILIEKNLS